MLNMTKAAADVQAANEILELLSDTVLKVGAILEKVYVERTSFDDFVSDHLPLQPQTAERIRCMYLVHAHKNGHVDLPEPFKALWAFG